MPYIAKTKVDAGEFNIYDVGDVLPDEIVDEGMVEAGSVELLTDKQFEALVDSDLARKSNAELREMCEARGLDADRRMNKDELVSLLEAGDASPVDEADDHSDDQGSDADPTEE